MDSSSIVFPFGDRWQCIFDPNQLFTGGVFRKVDLRAEQDERLTGHWAEGCIFQHIRKPRFITIQNGMIKESVTAPTVGVDKKEPGQGESLTGERNTHD